MIRVKLNETEQKVNISLKCLINADTEREFNLNRPLDEPISATFQKLYSNFVKQVKSKDSKSNKKLKKDEQSQLLASINPLPVEEEVPIYLYDLENNKMPLTTLNRDAWKDNQKFKLQEQSFNVAVNLPCVKKMSLSKLMIAEMSGIVKVEFDSEDRFLEKITENSKYMWYYSTEIFEEDAINKTTKLNLEWKLMEEGVNLKACKLHECTKGRFIRVVCVPGDGGRDGLAFEVVSKDTVLGKIELNNMPMTIRHELTREYLNSEKLRVMTYNILANCYSDTTMAKEQLFSHCPLEYLDFRYRRVLLVHEIQNYRSDVIFLQECETDFLEEDLTASMTNYQLMMKTKNGSKEGCGTLFRKDRFRFVKSHDIAIIEELRTNQKYEKLWKNISDNEAFMNTLNERNTIFQVTQVESLEYPGKHFLLANTHLFFHPTADFTRLLQSIVCAKYIEKLKFDLIAADCHVKDVSILFGGDFNSDPPSHAFTYLFTQSIPFENLTDDEKKFVTGTDDDLVHSLNFSAYTDFPYTNYTVGFNGILDHFFYETDAFELEKVIPIPSVEKIQENIALPSRLLPSDHVALVFELKIKINKN